MRGVLPYPVYVKMKRIRMVAYLAVILCGLINIFCPFVAHADIFGFYAPDVYDEITENVTETNDLLNIAFKFSKESPFSIINTYSSTVTGATTVATNIITAVKSLALVTATLLLMVDFFRKTVNFEWSSRWENILLFLVKIVAIKVVIQNADVIIGYVYAMVDTINAKAISGNIGDSHGNLKFLPCGDPKDYTVELPVSFARLLKKGWWDFWYDLGADEASKNKYKISLEAVKMFYPSINNLPDATGVVKVEDFALPDDKANFMPTLERYSMKPVYLVMKAIAYIIFVVVIGRTFELCIYTIFAPLPLATFASETSTDVAKNFLKNYIATVLQVSVIIVMFIAYAATNVYAAKFFDALGSSAPPSIAQNLILIGALGLGVMKSGAWSKKICGIG